MDEHGQGIFEIIPMDFSHIDRLVLLENHCFSTPWSEDGFVEELTNPLAVFFVAIHKKTNKLVGYIGMHHILDEGYITNIAVFEQYRNQGVAHLLMSHMFIYAHQKEMSFITLEVRQSNKIAIHFYDKFGFVNLGARKNFYSNPTEHAWIMTIYKKEIENNVYKKR